MYHLLIENLKPCARFVIHLLKTAWGWILAFHILCFCLSVYFKEMGDLYTMNSQMTLVCRFGEATAALLLSFFYLLLVPARFEDYQKNSDPRPFLHLLAQLTKPLFLESLRVFVRIIMWSLALIIPGVFQYYRLSLVSFIVILNPAYARGQVDALAHSHALIRGHDIGWIGILILSGLLDASYGLLSLLPYFPSEWLLRFAISLLTIPLSLYSYSILVHLYDALESAYSKTKLELVKN